MKKILLTSIALLTFMGVANASTPNKYCRQYDSTHLAKHPHQLITAMCVSTKPEWFHLDVKIRDRPETLQAEGNCKEIRNNQLRCQVECDGGGFIMTKNVKSAILELTRIRMSSCSTNDIEINSGIDDKIFILYSQ